MHVTFVSSGLGVGGAESALLRLLPAMRAFGVESNVISLRTEGHVGPLLCAVNVPVGSLGLPAPRSIISAVPTLLSQVRRYAPDLVHGWMYHGNLAASIAAGNLGVPAAWGIRQSLGPGARDKWLTRRLIQLGAKLSPRADLIVYNSVVAREQHESRGYAKERAEVIPNGFDTTQLRPDPETRSQVRAELGLNKSSLVVAMVARFHATKDYPTFLRACSRVSADFADAVFLMVGEGVDEANADLRRLTDELDLSGRTRLLGRRDDVARLMTAFDVLCLTSSAEGFPNVIGEAMSCGVPCIGTAVGEVASIIGDTGEVVQPGDASAVAAGIYRLLALKADERRALGGRARQRIVERFSIEQAARRYAELLLVTARRAG